MPSLDPQVSQYSNTSFFAPRMKVELMVVGGTARERRRMGSTIVVVVCWGGLGGTGRDEDETRKGRDERIELSWFD